jgi:hypothetical protein
MEERRLRVFEKFGPKRDEVMWEWGKLHNEELNGLYTSPTILWVIKSRRMRWAGYVAWMREGRGMYRVLVGKPEPPIYTWGYPGVDGRLILRGIFRK